MSNVTRRHFLEQSLWAAAAAGLATTRIAGAAPKAEKGGASTESAPSTKTSPNDRIGLAVIGVHGRGMNHVDAYAARDDVDVIAICDVDESQIGPAQQAVTKKGKPTPRAVQDIRRLLEDPSIHAVSIAIPNHWHALAAIWAMQAGKDVYVEKPVSHNVSEGRRIVEAARKYNRICQAGTQSRSNQACRDAIEYIHSGKIGKVTLSRGLCYKRRDSIGRYPDSAVPAGVNYDIWQGPAPERPFNRNRFHYNWHWNFDYGNGDMGNQGVHQMDIARWALNQELPTSAVSVGGRFCVGDQGNTPNTQVAAFDYGDAHLIFEVRGLSTKDYMGVSIGNLVHGTDGFVAFSSDYAEVAAFDNKGEKVQTFKGGGDHFANFLKAVRSRRSQDLHCDIPEGHLSSALCHLANISYQLGTMQPFSVKTHAFGDDADAYETFGRFEQHLAESGVRLNQANYHLGPRLRFDPRSETFQSNPEANAMLTREYRKPFEVPAKV